MRPKSDREKDMKIIQTKAKLPKTPQNSNKYKSSEFKKKKKKLPKSLVATTSLANSLRRLD